MGSISILLVDDSITIQKVVGIIFGSGDYTLTVVDNGKAAVQKAQEIKPDVLLIDALMPGMSGYEVCEAIRKDQALAAKPLLLMTGAFEPFDEEKANKCGADDHIIKPFESKDLVSKVQALYELGLARSSAASSSAPVEEPAPVSESLLAEEPFVAASFAGTSVFDNGIPEASFAFDQDEPQPFAEIKEEVSLPVAETATARTPDDPWGAFTQPLPESDSSIPASFALETEPDTKSFLDNNSFASMPIPSIMQEDPHIGTSWTPADESVFDFTEEPVITSPAVTEEPVTAGGGMTEFSPDSFTAVSSVEPVIEKIAEPPAETFEPVAADTEPVMSEPDTAAVPAAGSPDLPVLSEEQLKAAIMAASKETIERIVWEVVPDLAETMIKEVLRRITEDK